MEERLDRIEEELEELRREVRELRRAVRELGARLGSAEREIGAAARLPGSPDTTEEIAELVRRVPASTAFVDGVVLSGRTSVLLGVAFLLRAVTGSGAWPPLAGIAVGVLFAAALFGLAWRDASRGRDLSATFYGLTAGAIAFPLAAEGTLGFGVLGPVATAVLLTAFSALGLAVAWLRRLRGLAWTISVFALGTAVLLLFRSHAPAPYAVHLWVLAAGLLAVAEGRGWPGLGWLSALAVDLALALLFFLVAGPRRPDWLASWLAAAVLLSFFLLYVGAFAARALRGGRPWGAFEPVQLALVLLVGFEGGVIALGEGGRRLAGAGAVVLAGLLVAAALRRVPPTRRAERVGLATLALLLAVEGVRHALPLPVAVLAWGVGAVGAAAAARRGRSTVLAAHAAVAGLAAAAGSGLLRDALLAGFGEEPPRPGWLAVVSLGLVGAAWGLLPARARRWTERLPAWFLGTALAVGGGGLAIELLAPLAGGDAGGLASLRTAVVAAVAVALAAAGTRRPELGWDAYPALALGGLKLLVQDLPRGRPATLFASLVLWGLALIAVPLVRRRLARRTPEGPDPADLAFGGAAGGDGEEKDGGAGG